MALLTGTSRRSPPRAPSPFTLIALGFSLGAAVHSAELVALMFGYAFRPGYPAPRHAVFAALDAIFAALALRAPRRLWLPVLLLLAQQCTTHGLAAWRSWTGAGPIDWPSTATMAFIIASSVIAVWQRFGSSGGAG